MQLVAAIRRHDHERNEFDASLHGMQIQRPDGRIRGQRQNLMERMKARRGSHR